MRPFTILLLALASSVMWAQSPIVVSGQITDAGNGLPIEGASISLGDQMRFTDSAGNYTFDAVPTGAAAVKVDARGYLAFKKNQS